MSNRGLDTKKHKGKSGHRHLGADGEIRRKRSDKVVSTLKEKYGSTLASGFRSDTRIGTVLERAGTKSTGGTHERRSSKADRLSMRIDEMSKAKLERAAAYRRESVSDYVVSRAVQAAEEDIMTYENIILAEPIWNVFFEALSRPPKFNPRLKELLELHDREVISE